MQASLTTDLMSLAEYPFKRCTIFTISPDLREFFTSASRDVTSCCLASSSG
jgi:hypothetical protein